ncbi:MAG TPA: ribbon-helix-helix protein, CopG family [Thermoanaerobaculia bacterium]|nr:ribbon-helix-helix protein, CopG family [Thermoanaerobaculia bacterium]
MPAPKKADGERSDVREVFYLRPEESKALAELAERERVSKSALVRRLVLERLRLSSDRPAADTH